MDERLQNILRLASSMPHGKDGKFVSPRGANGKPINKALAKNLTGQINQSPRHGRGESPRQTLRAIAKIRSRREEGKANLGPNKTIAKHEFGTIERKDIKGQPKFVAQYTSGKRRQFDSPKDARQFLHDYGTKKPRVIKTEPPKPQQRASKFGRDSYTKEELRLKDQQELRDALKKLKANRKK